MNTKLLFFKISTLTLFLFGFNHLVKAQKDTIPPIISKCSDTANIQMTTVWILVLPDITDNQSDPASIQVKQTWGVAGAVNTLVRGMYKLTIEATDSNGNKTLCEKFYRVDDFIAPVINLNTSDTVCHRVNTPYLTVQATATDNYYNNNQVSLSMVYSNVNPNVEGLYVETYEAIDGSLNKTTKTRYVLVSSQCANSSVNNILKVTLKVYPNPASGWITLDLMDVGSTYQIRIVAMDGKTVFDSVFSHHMKINANDFSDGVYTVQLTSGQTVFNKKLVIQK